MRIGKLIPLYKKEDVNLPGNYRGISLLPSAYKVYTYILSVRLVKEVEELGLLPDGQAGFRKKRSTIDNIYILNYLIKKTKHEKQKLYAVFVDLKAAFDTVNREKLWLIMENLGISKYLIEKIKELYEETKVKVRFGNEFTEEFWTVKGLRQGCILSPILFCIYIASLETVMKNIQIGRVLIRKIRIWSLAYADDLVLLALNREAIIDMLDTLRNFFIARDLILSTSKTKVLVFNKGNNAKKERWEWMGEKLEEVKIFCYLGFIFNRQGNFKDHLKQLKNKGILAAKITWGLGERKCKNDFRRRRMLFNYLVKSVMSYGAEIWGWVEKKELEKIQLDYYRWVLRLDFNTPRYIIYKETGINKLQMEWAIRAWKFERKIEKLEDNRLLKIIFKNVNEISNEKLLEERKIYFNNLGWSTKFMSDNLMTGREQEKKASNNYKV